MKIPPAMFIALVCAVSNAFAAEPVSPEQKLATMGLPLQAVPPPIANYVPAVRSGNLVFLAGQISRAPMEKSSLARSAARSPRRRAPRPRRLCAAIAVGVEGRDRRTVESETHRSRRRFCELYRRFHRTAQGRQRLFGPAGRRVRRPWPPRPGLRSASPRCPRGPPSKST